MTRQSISRRTFEVSILSSLLLMFAGAAWGGQTAAAQDDIKEFNSNVQKYVAIQKKAVAMVPALPKETADVAAIEKHQMQVADAIRSLRPRAMPGEVFTPSAARMIRAIVKTKLDGVAGRDAKTTALGEGNPKSAESTTPVKMAVNAAYPSTASLSTVPPSLLMALPNLPKEVEFRFVGRNLILRDTEANIIVDLLENVI